MTDAKLQTKSDKQRILVCPLDWGLGHATRCIPLIFSYLEQGHQVLLAGSGPSLQVLKQTFPQLPVVDFPSFTLQYSRGSSQIWAVLKAMPRLVRHTYWEHKHLPMLIQQYGITQVLSDNRFGLFCKQVPCYYLTHQLHIKLPRPFGFLESLVARLHRSVIHRYTACFVPDFEDLSHSLAGELSHPKRLPNRVQYIGPLTRFSLSESSPAPAINTSKTLTVAVLSGVEPQRSIFEKYLLDSLQLEPAQRVVLVQGKPTENKPMQLHGKVEVYASLPTQDLRQLLLQATHIICRSGYSTVMDLHALGKLSVTTWVPTPGQPEQEYLATYLRTKDFR
jgi:uncharacterized protein (TIGR00661 family)